MNLVMSDKSLDISFDNDNNNVYFDLSKLKISTCIGCFTCWTKTPGKCIIRDDATKVYPVIAKAENLIYVTKIKYGSYDSIMKTMLERAIPIQQAFIRILHGECHHVQRDVASKKAVIIGYGNISKEEKVIFEELVKRNTQNMNIESYEVVFVEESNVEEAVSVEVSKWKKQ